MRSPGAHDDVAASPFHAPPQPQPPRVKSSCGSSTESSCGGGGEDEEDDPPCRRRRRVLPQCKLFCVPRDKPFSSSAAAATTIRRVPAPLSSISIGFSYAAPIAVAIGPYHRDGSPQFHEMEEAKKVARDEFCRVAGQQPELLQEKITSLAARAMECYAEREDFDFDDDKAGFEETMFTDGCFLLQFMACMCPVGEGDAPTPAADGLLAVVHARIDAIARDVMLLENQLPWFVLQALMDFAPPGVSWPVDKFLDLMASAFDVGNEVTPQQPQQPDTVLHPPPHLLGLFHRRQVGAARTQSLHVPSLSSVSSTAVELAEMGVKITASKAKAQIFGDMIMTKRRGRLGVYGELALAPVVLNDLTTCWLFNMLAHEACLGASCADNFAVSSYVSVVALLMNRPKDVQELRGKGVVVSALSDESTLATFKELAAHVSVGYRYYDVFERLQEYRRERWLWIAVHRFLYKNVKTIIAVLSAIGVLAGLFKTILSLKQPQRG